MNLIEVVTLVSGSGAVSGASGWWLSQRANRRDDFRAILDERARQADDRARQVDELLGEVRALKAENVRLELRIEGLEAGRSDFPFPSWQVNRDGTYVYVNKPYVDLLLAPLGMTEADVIGKRDADIWPLPSAHKLRMLQTAVMMAPDRRARIDGFELHPGIMTPLTILKVPDFARGTLVGFTGYAIDILPQSPITHVGPVN